ncbi:hypothetical protein [Crocosphaera sp. XPORK-15E]|uniref:hypothetical protein n=1 Tax=Crocosphaera sp. XPORK-15E TaxID=3110247 RepID=UPI002B200F23|nr:hypothetical protein [Crocosphaera sp. XPORK-15E]MEA5536745.1 hypothetical protein [Crocosphaera sp. XPORK-15E]
MIDPLFLLEQAVSWLLKGTPDKPSSEQAVMALVNAEKVSRKTKPLYTPSQLKGTWRLCFITGTKQAQQRGGMVLRSGRFLPRWARIELTYIPQIDGEFTERGTLENCIKLGGLELTLTGPAKFISPKNILAFDFTKMSLIIGGITLYNGKIRGGKKSEDKFQEIPLSKQAFFTYFLMENNLIAARGKGGGLALWGR